METKRKKTLFNVIMVVLILIIAGCGIMAVGNLKGWFGKDENSVLLFHKISLYTECGNLTMIGTNSDIMWEPRIRKYIAADGGFHLEADDEYLDLPVYEEMHNDEGKCFREMFSDTWPDSIKLFLEDFYRDFYLGKKMDSNAQFLISVCQAWKDLGNSIGSANIIHAYTTKPIKISEIVK